MNERKIRDSTRKVTENQKKKFEIQEEIKKEKKVSKALGKLHRKETEKYVDSALEQAEYAVDNFDKSTEEEERVESSLDVEVFLSADEKDLDDDNWDPLGAENSEKIVRS